MDSVGVFCRTVADAVHGLNVIAGKDEKDPMTHDRSANGINYSDFLASGTALKGPKLGLSWSPCWDRVAPQRKEVALRIFNAIENAGAENMRTAFPCAEGRIVPDGNWNWKRGEETESEFTIIKTDAYNNINAYRSQLSGSAAKSVEDILAFNIENAGTEDTNAAIKVSTPPYTSTQMLPVQLNFPALLLCDHKGAGQQLAAQAGELLIARFTIKHNLALTPFAIITIPIGIDRDGFPVSLSFQHRAWQERMLISWATAVEDLVHEVEG
ncbi:MAG: hypothetical protein Q9199_000478 [Rusavskia elegans]